MKLKAKSCVLGFDIGASQIKGVLARGGEIVRSDGIDTPRSFKELLAAVGDLRNKLCTDKKIAGVGIAIAGVFDGGRKKMLRSPNMSFLDGRDLERAFSGSLGVRRLKIEHDVHALLLAEKQYGAARSKKNVFCLTLGSGIGGAFMVNGEIIYGAHGAAGEAGHMIMKLKVKSQKSKMEQPAEFEELASNKFIRRNLGVDFREAFRRAEAGDKKAAVVFAALGENLGVGLANIINIFDPEMIILGGGIIEARKFLASGIKRGVGNFVTSPAARRTKIIYSRLGRYGGALGATLLFSEK